MDFTMFYLEDSWIKTTVLIERMKFTWPDHIQKLHSFLYNKSEASKKLNFDLAEYKAQWMLNQKLLPTSSRIDCEVEPN
jgi:hypothetical protein